MSSAQIYDLHVDSKVASYIRLGHTGYKKHTQRLELMEDVPDDLHKTVQVKPRTMTPYKSNVNANL